jgi:transcriptional regulator with XRE-family HTH domain
MIALKVNTDVAAALKTRRYSRRRTPIVPRPPKTIAISHRDIGQRLRALRTERDYSQARLAEILGTHQTNVSEMERGVRGITVQQLVRLSNALKVSPNDLLGVGSKENGHTPLPARFTRRLREIAILPKSEQQALLKIMDSMIQAHRGSKASARS